MRQQRFLVMLPALLVPFLTLVFVALGGGKNGNAVSSAGSGGGIDMNLPQAYLKDRPVGSKMSYYRQAEKDSLSEQRQLERDRYIDAMDPSTFLSSPESSARSPSLSGPANQSSRVAFPGTGDVISTLKSGRDFSPPVSGSKDADETRIYSKLSQLKKLVDGSEPQPALMAPSPPDTVSSGPAFNGAGVRQMQQMMQAMQQSGGDDTEMAQINAMLEKILDIQHPQRVEEKLDREMARKEGRALRVSTGDQGNAASFFDGSKENADGPDSAGGEKSPSGGFYSLTAKPELKSLLAIDATVYGRQVLEDASVVRLRLSNDIHIRGTLIPRGTLVYGVASFQGSRLQIRIKSIRYGNFLFPVNLAVYDLDGMEGIYVPGGSARQAVSRSADQAMQTLGLQALNPSLSAQAASAGIETARRLLHNRIRTVRVTVNGGYQVLLKDQGEKTSLIPSL